MLASDALARDAKVEEVRRDGEWDSDLEMEIISQCRLQWPGMSDLTRQCVSSSVGFIEQVYTHKEHVVNICIKYELPLCERVTII